MNRTLLSHFTGLRSLLGRALPALLAITVMAATGALAGIAHAAATVDTIVVKIRDDALPPDARVLPVEFGDLLGAAAAVSLAQIGVERDGAFRLRLTQPLPFVEARAAVNRVRMLPQVLYAQLPDPTVPSASPFLVPGAAQPPVTKMIVKYRDPALSWLSDRDGALDAAQLNRLSVAAGRSFANERAMSGGAFVVRLFQPVPADQAQTLVQSLESVPEIEYAEPDLRMYPTIVPNDSLYGSQQWDLKPPAQSAGGANLPPAWDITTGSSAVRIAVLDTGILPHPDLIGRYLAGYDMIADALVGNDGNGRDSDPTDPGDWITLSENQEPGGYFQGCRVGSSSWHGTHVAGTIGASSNNAQGIAGINWVSQIVPVRVLGKCGGYTSDIADAMRWAAGLTVTGVPGNPNPARVISLSLGGGGACGTTFQSAINAALAAGSLFTIAAGNDNADAKDFSPGNCAGVITVAATQAAGARASYSNHGATVDIAAPGGGDGVGIVSTLNSGTTTANPSGYIYVGYQGTSMATPHLAGIASLMLSANSTLTPAQVLSTIQTTARAFPTGTGRDCTSDLGSVTGTIKYCGAGIVDAGAAVAAVAGGPGATTTLISSSSHPAAAGALVTFTASVTGTSPTGTVTFRDGGVTIATCSAAPLAGVGSTRTATCGISTLATGVHSIVATYNGDAGNATSSSPPLSQTITGAAGSTSTVVSSSANPATAGVLVTFTASVTGTLPTGTVTFRDGGVTI
ncbi:MAG: S8 family serine peptidase, partial [Burkholderiales bacterium]|nr:S8 family serine peptidase [Burkholderiales bacterium]